ncbi:MAG: ferrochelatase [Proteobacteria bacterium]|nr:ferrochelatase [Pseudomonadota bacterium]
MRFRPEPAASPSPSPSPSSAPVSVAPATALLLVNLGTPDAPTPAALRRYLAEFLSDPRVVEIPRLAWWPILHGIILRLRPAKSAAKYRSIWRPDGSPLAAWTERQASAVAGVLAARGQRIEVRHAMRYGRPAMGAVLDELRAAGCTRVLVLPLYPQYAAATTGSAADALHRWALRARRVPELRSVADYHDDAGYVGALAHSVQRHWQQRPPAERLLLSFHGVPERSRQLGDPYHDQCQRTAALLRERLALPADRLLVTFQSRFGKAQWLQPYTEPTLRELARQGIKSVDVMCPGFAADCLETLEEIAQEAREAFLHEGGQTFNYLPCLNDDEAWIEALADLAERHLQGWDTHGATTAGAAHP